MKGTRFYSRSRGTRFHKMGSERGSLVTPWTKFGLNMVETLFHGEV